MHRSCTIATDALRVLLLWPGGLMRSGANFGVPQLLSMAGVLRQRLGAEVVVVDLPLERAFGPVDLRAIGRRGYDLCGISCYSSYDYLKVMALAATLRAELPEACFVAGGYHPSAVPEDFTGPDSPFDYVVVGDGEAPLLHLAERLGRGERPASPVRPAEPWRDLDELPPYDWSLLERYRPIARQRASQAEIYLSRGCPRTCRFCMERAKGHSTWRAFEPGRAVEELRRLDAFLDLSQWTLFIADALFGHRKGWRRRVLAELARRPLRARKIWLLTRADGLETDDLELMARANVAPGFGLESGDPRLLELSGKTSQPAAYLEQVERVARTARSLELPFGANVIVGHPGESPESLRRSAGFLRRLFLDADACHTGFLSVDPFRLYPGTAIAEHRTAWHASTGMRVHRYPWWYDGDQDFLAEWIDPSDALDFRAALTLRRELFDPLLRAIADRFAYLGPAADYFQRALDEQLRHTRPRHYLHRLGLWHLWRGLVAPTSPAPAGRGPSSVAGDEELAELGRRARAETLARCRFHASPAVLAALHEVPRERFVALEELATSADDRPLPLTADDRSTLSALHAYAETFAALRLAPGDRLVELGSGNGYGAMLAAEVVGPRGHVLTLEVCPELAAEARAHLRDHPQVTALEADAHDVARWRGAEKVYVAFAVAAVPSAWLEALADGGRLVAPIGAADEQLLTLFERDGSRNRRTELGPVRYVMDRTA